MSDATPAEMCRVFGHVFVDGDESCARSGYGHDVADLVEFVYRPDGTMTLQLKLEWHRIEFEGSAVMVGFDGYGRAVQFTEFI